MSSKALAVRVVRGARCEVVVTLDDGRTGKAGGNRARRAVVAVVAYTVDPVEGRGIDVSLRADCAAGESLARSMRQQWDRNPGHLACAVEVVPVVDPDDVTPAPVASSVEKCGPHTVCVGDPCETCAAPHTCRPCDECGAVVVDFGLYWAHSTRRGESDRVLCGACWASSAAPAPAPQGCEGCGAQPGEPCEPLSMCDPATLEGPRPAFGDMVFVNLETGTVDNAGPGSDAWLVEVDGLTDDEGATLAESPATVARHGVRVSEVLEGWQRWQAHQPCALVGQECATCALAGVAFVPWVNPLTATVVPWSVMGDPRRFAFICDECAADWDELAALDRASLERNGGAQ